MSTRSSSSRRPPRSAAPTWRTSIRQTPAASISLVCAQSEHVAPLGSAKNHLPLLASDTASITSHDDVPLKKDESDHSMRQASVGRQCELEEEDRDRSRKLSRVQSRVSETNVEDLRAPSSTNAPVGEDHDQAQALPGPRNTPLPQITVHTEAQFALPPRFSGHFETSTNEVAIPMKSASSPLSWFGSFSRTKATEPSAVEPANALAASTSPTPTKATTAEAPRTSTAHTSARVTAPTSRSTPTSASTRTPASTVSTTTNQLSTIKPAGKPQPAKRAVSAQHIISVDEEVPRTKLSPLASSFPPAEVTDEAERTRKASITSLNASSSRFTLKIPLLGRPKVPLDKIVAVAQVVDVPTSMAKAAKEGEAGRDADGRDTDAQPSVSALAVVDGDLSTQPAITAIQETASVASHVNAPVEAVPPLEEALLAEGDKMYRSTPSTSSWWDYVGWRSAPLADSGPLQEQKQAAPGSTKGDIHVVIMDTSASPFPNIPAPATPTPTPVSAAPATPRPQDMQYKPNDADAPSPTDQKPASVLSAQTVRSQGSAWYSPWAWYAASPVSPTQSSTPSGATVTAPSPASDEPQQKTDSERVKEQALARDEPSSEPRKAIAIPSPPMEVRNPIQASVSTHRASWASFFMSRSLITKTISDEHFACGEGGMEVMHLDSDSDKDEPAPASTPSDPIAIPPARPIQQHASISPESPSAAAEKVKKPETPFDQPTPKEKQHHKQKSISKQSQSQRQKQKTPRSPSPAPSKAGSVASSPAMAPRRPNLVLPGFKETFHLPPRSNVPPSAKVSKSKLAQTLSLVSGALFSKEEPAQGKIKGKEKMTERENAYLHFGKELPKALDVIGEQLNPYIKSGGCRVVVVGVAGWMPGPVTRTIAGGLPSSSAKFVNMTCQALERFEHQHGFQFKKITKMPLEGDGAIERKVSKVYSFLLANEEWMEDLRAADVIFVATHSQGSIISTHLIDRLIREHHIITSRNAGMFARAAATVSPGGVASIPSSQAQRVCYLALSGIHLGPLRYFSKTSLLQPYIQYFENSSASELFEFQNTESPLSKAYVKALNNILDHGTKVVYIASLNDQVVPIYSGIFSAASHPNIVRALYIDGDAYHTSDFLTNLLILLVRIMNAGLSDGGLLAHLSEATAGSLNGIGHSTIYEEPDTYSLAVNYFFLANDGDGSPAQLTVQPFDAVIEQNDYEIPWSLRDMIADERVAYFFVHEFAQLRDAFDDWQPKTNILREVKRKLQPIQRLSTIAAQTTSKL